MKLHHALKMWMGEGAPIYPHDQVAVYLASDVDALKEGIRIAITELDAVEKEIGVPSKALPLLRAAQGEGESHEGR